MKALRRLAMIVWFFAPTHTSAAAERVALQVQSKSWVTHSVFDVEDFDRLCSAVAIELTTGRGALPIVATAVIQYNETKGAGFSHFGVGVPIGYGTNITYKLTLLESKASKTLISVSGAAETPAGLPVEQFHDAARQAFKASPAYHFSCTVIAAALGSHNDLLHLLPWAILDREGAAIVEKLGFRPETPDQRAYIALAKGDFSALRSLDHAAVEPLLVLFQNSRVARDEIGTFPASDADNAKTLSRALALLSPLEDARIADVLATFLNDYSDYRTTDDPVVTPLLLETLRALGRTGDLFTLPLLDEWQAGDSTIAKTAQAAAAALRAKLSRNQ